ncbi:MAG: vitamin K epoxide reductase family protein [Candidatus Sungbacteria bacterium]|uniref:Vitamin K epoxide reductase family protein n=1 Tax=Candidatus Sungiibacteriota bacterium TaxID=2750080 RepID=A0A9D6QVJ3_9BACT|nr:vitamin K epoxide reductase family protein [Candidatus Sungbacteria bacterium]
MMDSKNSLTTPSPRIPKWLAPAIIIVSAIGLLDSAYLAMKYYLGEPVTCSLFWGCEAVTTSQYAAVGHVPTALFGVLFYLGTFLLGILYYETKKEIYLRQFSYLSAIGFLVSLGLLWLELFVIRAICVYCSISTLASTILFICGVFSLRNTSSARNSP